VAAILVVGCSATATSTPLRSANEISGYDNAKLAQAAAQDIRFGLWLADCKGGHEREVLELRQIERELRVLATWLDDKEGLDAAISQILADTDCSDDIWFPESRVHDGIVSARKLVDILQRRARQQKET
jgi:hypothetical protein